MTNNPFQANTPPDTSQDQHKFSDVDSSPQAQHHTLGTGTNQAAKGDHIHIIEKHLTKPTSPMYTARNIATIRHHASTVLGRLVIVTDLFWADTSQGNRMVKFNLHGFVYEAVGKSTLNLDVSFYNYPQGPFIHTYSCSNLGTMPIAQVEWGYRTSDNKIVIIITPASASSEHWDYLQATVDALMYSYTAPWEMFITDDLTPYTINRTQVPAQPTIDAAPTTWQASNLLNGWVNYGLGHANAQYRKMNNQVTIRGLVKNGTGPPSIIFNLPAGYRPPDNLIFATVAYFNVFARITITSAGDVQWESGGTNVWVAINFSFLVD